MVDDHGESLARLDERVASLQESVNDLKTDLRAQTEVHSRTAAKVVDLAQSVAVLTPEYRSMVKTTSKVEETVGKLSEVVSDLTHWRSRVIGIAIGASALTSGAVSGIMGALGG